MPPILFILVLLGSSASHGSEVPYYSGNDGIVTVEQASDRIIIFKSDTDWNLDKNIIWSWSVSNSPAIKPVDYHYFHMLSDAKRVSNGSCVIICASGGGIALIRLSDKQTLFYARAEGNTHSVELLPDGNLVSASSTGGYLRLFSTDPSVSQFPDQVKSVKYPFADAHGVTWDQRGEQLWAVGGKTLKRFAYNHDRKNPALTLLATYNIPDIEGHDLFPLPGKDKLVVTSSRHVWFFDLKTETFEPFPRLADIDTVKSVSLQSADGRVIYLVPKVSWWTDSVSLLDGESQTRTGAKFYKARWWVPNEFSYGIPVDDLRK